MASYSGNSRRPVRTTLLVQALLLFGLSTCGNDASLPPPDSSATVPAGVGPVSGAPNGFKSIGVVNGSYENGHLTFGPVTPPDDSGPGVKTQNFGAFSVAGTLWFSTRPGDGNGTGTCTSNQYCATVDVANHSSIALDDLSLEITRYTSITPPGATGLSWAGTPFTYSQAYANAFTNPSHVEAAFYGNVAGGESKGVEFKFNNGTATGYSFQLAILASVHRNDYLSSTQKNATVMDACAMAGSTQYLVGSDDAETGVPMPFPYTLYDLTYDRAVLGSNGYVLFQRTGDPVPSIADSASNVSLVPGGTPPGLYPFWDDLAFDASDGVCVATAGTTPNRNFVVTWKNAKINDAQPAKGTWSTSRVTTSLILTETSDRVAIEYLLPSGGIADLTRGSSATTGEVGIVSGTRVGTDYSFDAPSSNIPTDPADYPFELIRTPGAGPVKIPTSVPVVEKFDEIGTSATATLPRAWKVDGLANPRTVGTYSAAGKQTVVSAGAAMSASAVNAIYSFGPGVGTTASDSYWGWNADRAIGWLAAGTTVGTGGTKSGNLYVQLQAPPDADLSGLELAYDIQKYRRGTNASGFAVQLYYSTDGTSWTSAGSSFRNVFAADANNNGFDPAPGSTISVPTTKLTTNIARNSLFYLAWNYTLNSSTSNDGSNAQALAIDNISVLGDAICVPSCAGKHCGDSLSNGCGGSCAPVCGTNQPGCLTSSDCQPGQTCTPIVIGPLVQNICIVPGTPCNDAGDCGAGEFCGHQNGASFGQDPAANICEPTACESIDRALNPCLDPANAGKQTACGPCPVCVPQCDGRSCGDDHCGGSCGTCGAGGTCLGSSCLGTTTVLSNLPTGPLPRSGVPFPEQQLGTVPGLIPATFSVNASGQSTYHIPLDVAPGRGGLQPDLALNYNSGQGNGVLGVGWSLEGLSVISRCDKTVAQDDLASTPRFDDDSTEQDAMCLDGKRLLVVGVDGDRVEYRTEVEEFSQIVRSANSSGYESFLVLTKSGRTLEFGNTADSRIPIPAAMAVGLAVGGAPDSGIVSMSYLLNKVTDRAGNTIQYQYDPRVSAGAGYEYLATSITYGWHDGESAPSAPVEVVFNYEARDDKLFGWKYGARQNVNDRISSIDIAVGSGTFRRYAMTYQIEGLPASDGSHPGRSILTDVTECARTPSMAGWDLQQAACKTPIHFDYSDPRIPSSASLIPTPFTLMDTPVNFQNNVGAGDTPAITGYALDLNGDGRTDFLIPEWHRPDVEGATRDEHCQPFPANHSENVGRGSCFSEWVVMWAQPDGTFTSTETGIPLTFQYPFGDGPQEGDWFSRICHGTGIVADLNNDGMDELIETDCDDEGHDQHSYSAIAFVNGTLQRIDLPNVPLGGHGSTGPTVGSNSETNDTPTDSAAAYLLDADGDGAPDLLECHAIGLSGGSVWTLYHNTHAANVADAFAEAHVVNIQALCGSTYGSHTVVDVDGDGRDELILRVNEGVPGTQRIVRFTGQGIESQDGVTNLSLLERIPNEPSYRTLDINGDGLVDFMSAFGKIDISRGDGTFDKYTQPVIDVGWGMDGNNLAGNKESVFRQAVPVDVDGDGMQDLVVPGKDRWVWLRSTGTGFVLRQFPTLMPLHTQNDALETFFQSALLADVDGDSYPDIIQLRRSDVGPTPVLESFPVLHFTGPAQPEVTAITDSLNARTEVNYSHLKDATVYTPGAGCVYPQHCEGKTPRRVVSKVDSWDKPQHPSDEVFTLPAKETTYQYSDGRLDLPRRAWLGFSDKESRESVDPGTPAAQLVAQISEFFDLDTYDSTAHLYPFAHQPRETDSTAEIGGEDGRYRRSKTINSFASRTENVKGISTWTASNVSNVYEGTSFLDEAQISGHTLSVDPPDQYGNVTHSTHSWSDSGGFIESRDVTTSFEWNFQTITAAWQISQVRQRLETSTVPATGLSKTRKELYSYFPNGLLHTDTRGTTQAEGRTTTLERDGYGNITSIVAVGDQADPRSVTVGYDLLGFAPTTITNGKGQITHVTVDARFGSITHTVDPNNLTSDTWFDNFGRTILQIAPDGTTKSTGYQFGPFLQLRPTRIQTSESGGETVTTDLDVLGRQIHSERTGLGGSLIAQSQFFDSRGFPQKIEWPHKVAVTDPKTSLSVFDNLGRITALIQPVGTTSSCYENRTSCQTNAIGYTTCKITDALGRLVASIDPHAGDLENCRTALAAAASRPATTYAYGPFGDLSSVTDVNGNVTTVETDNYGRKTAMVDPDSGRRTFGYNGLDELTRTEDANGNIVAFIRDALGRVSQRQETRDFHPEIPERDTNWTWDGDGGTTTDALIGALTHVVTPEGHTETYHYDTAKGRLSSGDELIAGDGGGTFSVSFDYDSNGLIQNVNYPQITGQHQVTVHHGYDSFGHLIGLKDPSHQVVAGGTFWSVDPATATDDYEQLTKETFGNGVQISRGYTPDGWVQDIQSTFNGSALHHVHYSLDADGNVLNRQDLVRTQWESFAYDQLGRLGCSLVGSNTDPAALSPACTGTLSASYSHDDLGRITGSLEAGSYAYPLASGLGHPVHAPTSVGDTTYTYDNNGNRSRQIDGAGNARDFSWTAFNKPLETWREGATPSDKLDLVHFEYDANQTRVKKETATLITAYLDGLYEQRTSKTGAATEHVFYVRKGASVVAQITQTVGESNDTVQYMQGDSLGSAQLVTDSAGTVLEERSYDAFGQARSAENWAQNLPSGGVATNNTSGFTGQERDDEFGLINMRGREYDPRIGQFLQADPIVQDPTRSQFLNRYSYVTNNPLKFVDPSGFEESGPGGSTASASGSFDDAASLKAPAGTTPSKVGIPGLNQLTAQSWHAVQGPVEGKPTGASGNPGASSAPAFDAHSPGAQSPGGSFGPDLGRIPNSMRRPGRTAGGGAEEGDDEDEEDDFFNEVKWGQRLEPLPRWQTELPPPPGFLDELSRQSPAQSRAEEILKSLDTPDGCRIPTVEEQAILDEAEAEEGGKHGGVIRSPVPVNGTRIGTGRALSEAERFLGKGYKDAGKGRFVSADGTRQVRMGDSDILGRHGGGPHLNFEELAPDPLTGRMTVINNSHVYLIDP